MSAVIGDVVGEAVEEVSGRMKMMSASFIRNLLSKWNEMYELSREEKSRRLQKLTEYFEGFCNDVEQCEEEKRLGMLVKIENKLKEYYKLQKDLAMAKDIDQMELRMPYSKFLKDVDKLVAHLLEEKDKRIGMVRKLRCEEQELCKELGIPPVPSFPNPIPTEQQLDSLQLKLFELHEEKINRLRIYKETQNIIINLNKLLEQEPITLLEKSVLGNSDDKFKPSTENMNFVERLKNSRQKQHDETVKRRQDLLERLAKLWDRLKVTSEDRESFLARNNTISKTHMAAIETEIDRCERLKRENIRQVIESAREEISDLWDKLTYTQEQRLQFRPFLTNHYSEDVLCLHELEIEKLKHFYLTNQHIFELAEKRNSLWERMLQLDQLAQDKNRLFSNRGGQLLKEEKERKDLEVNLPKVDKQLKAALVDYGKPFLWHGEDLLLKITKDWDERLKVTVYQKLTRKIGQRKALRTEVNNLLGSVSAKKQKRAAATPSGGSCSKVRRRDNMDIAATPQRGARTPGSLAITPINTSSSSLASFTQFHEGIVKSATRAVLRDLGNTPGVVHSSPTLATPRRATPASTKKTPQTISRLAYCRKRLPINI